MYLIDLLQTINDNTIVVITDIHGHTISRNAMKNKIDKIYYGYIVDRVSIFHDDSLGGAYLNIAIEEE